jgi:hypothetical protein
MKFELQNIILGKSQIIHGATIQATARYLERSKEQVRWIKRLSVSENKKQNI